MSFFIKEENVRPGNRGGRSLFNWNDIRLLNNKERESYLGVTQSIGFLDKGGKWRKRDWWQSKDKCSDFILDNYEILSEKEKIKNEEERLFNETFNNLYGGSSNTVSKSNYGNSNRKKEKLTVFEWKELMKKEANINPNDPKIFEFYENDEHKRGLGMKPNISFRTNPYEKDTLQNLRKLEGEGLNSDSDNKENISQEKDDKNFDEKDKKKIKNKKEKSEKYDNHNEKNLINNNPLVSDYMQKKDHLGGKSYAEIMDIWQKQQQERKNFMNFSNLENKTKEKKEKKNKKEKKKKDKKGKKKESKDKKSDNDSESSYNKRNKRKNRSYSRSRSRSKSDSRRKHKERKNY